MLIELLGTPRPECNRRDCPYRTSLLSGAYDDREARVFLDLLAERVPTMAGLCRQATSSCEAGRMDGGQMSMLNMAIEWGRRRNAAGQPQGSPGSLDADLLPHCERFGMLEFGNPTTVECEVQP